MDATRLLSLSIIALFYLHSSSSFKDYEEAALEVHNIHRSEHNTPNLTLNESLNARAVLCAEYYIKIGRINHNCSVKAGAGENLWAMAGATTNVSQYAVRTRDASEDLYTECRRYCYTNPKYQDPAGHFTQFVWKPSTELGIGVATNNVNLTCVVVALYYPHGNVIGSNFRENVLRSKYIPCRVSGVDRHSAVYPYLGLIFLFKVAKALW